MRLNKFWGRMKNSCTHRSSSSSSSTAGGRIREGALFSLSLLVWRINIKGAPLVYIIVGLRSGRTNKPPPPPGRPITHSQKKKGKKKKKKNLLYSPLVVVVVFKIAHWFIQPVSGVNPSFLFLFSSFSARKSRSVKAKPIQSKQLLYTKRRTSCLEIGVPFWCFQVSFVSLKASDEMLLLVLEPRSLRVQVQ